eukprot:3941327-Rhodomonas_salina.2
MPWTQRQPSPASANPRAHNPTPTCQLEVKPGIVVRAKQHAPGSLNALFQNPELSFLPSPHLLDIGLIDMCKQPWRRKPNHKLWNVCRAQNEIGNYCNYGDKSKATRCRKPGKKTFLLSSINAMGNPLPYLTNSH